MKIAVCMPSGDYMHVDCAHSLNHMMIYTARERRDIHQILINEKQTILEIGRHRLVLQAMAIKAEYILWVDSDMTFQYDSLARLVDSGKDIIGCQALMRCPPHASNTYDFEQKQVIYPENIQEVKYIGTGFLLVRTKVFETIGKPYFKTTYNDGDWQGEDLNFCDRARAAGFKIWCHGPLSKGLYHIGSKKYGYEKKEDVPSN